jgi:hypothetical protein
MEETWTRLRLVVALVKLAAQVAPAEARPILSRMVSDKTWQRYKTEVMPSLKAALHAVG